MSINNYDVIIIGAGPCGLGAATNFVKNNVNYLLLEASAPGGKINIAPRVDNYPGFKKIPGPDLAYALYERAINNGVNITGENVISLTKNGELFEVITNKNAYHASFVLVCSGTKERKLGLENEDIYFGKGISYCAICDGHFFKNKNVIVIGGGNSALKEAIYLAPLVKKLTLIHRRTEFRGNNALVNELNDFSNVEILTPYIPTKINGTDILESIEIENVNTKERLVIETDGLFPLVGQIPNTSFILIDGVKNEYSNVPVNKDMMTSCDGLYAGGDVLPRDIRQIYLAEHDGVVASNSIIKKIKGE